MISFIFKKCLRYYSSLIIIFFPRNILQLLQLRLLLSLCSLMMNFTNDKPQEEKNNWNEMPHPRVLENCFSCETCFFFCASLFFVLQRLLIVSRGDCWTLVLLVSLRIYFDGFCGWFYTCDVQGLSKTAPSL